jgi:glycerol-3-phosphate acyltransferase PlsY
MLMEFKSMPVIDQSVGVLLIVAIIAYLIGAIPFGIVFARLFKLGDLRAIGSGNIGATNVLRTGNKVAAFLTLLCDSGKGAFAVLLAYSVLGNAAAQVAGLFAFLGHLYPVYLRFKGGKGVAIFLGILLALNFWGGLMACAAWLVVAAILRMSSASALGAAIISPAFMWITDRPDAILLCVVLTALVWWKHRGNITRIVSGDEPKIGAGR